MTITVPTADPRSEEAAERTRSRWRAPWWIAAATLGLTLVVWGDSELPASPSGEPRALSLADLSEVPAMPAEFPPGWTRTSFPGQGTFTGLAIADHGAVAVGQRVMPAGQAFAWSAAPDLDLWEPRTIQHAERAAVRDVAPYRGGFVVGGALVTPGLGDSTPALWFGAAGADFVLVDHPFPGPGRVDAVRVVDGELVVIGQGGAPFTDNLRPGTARFGRVLAGQPGAWDEVTPAGFSVLVTDLVAYDGGWMAVGADAAGGAMWWRPPSAPDWVEVSPAGLERATVTDVVVHPDGGLVALARTWDSDGTVRSQLLRGDGPHVWAPIGAPLRRDVGWVEPVPGGVIGGMFDAVGETGGSPLLWGFEFSGGWQYFRLAGNSTVGGPTTLRSMVGGLIAGGVAGQPALWSEALGPVPVPVPVMEVAAPQWERVAPSHGVGVSLTDTGNRLFAFDPSAAAGLSMSADGTVWAAVDLPGGMAVRGFAETRDGVVVWGDAGEAGVVLDAADDGTRRVILTLPGAAVRHVIEADGALIVFARSGNTLERIHFGPSQGGGERPQERAVLDRLPPRMLEHDGLLIGLEAARPLAGLLLSEDLGTTWTHLDVPVFTMGVSAGSLMIVTAEAVQRVLVLDRESMSLHEVDVGGGRLFGSASSLRAALVTWADGIAARGPAVLRLSPGLEGELVTLDLTPESGLGGVLVDLVPGPRGFARVYEDGTPVLYRWTGAGP